MTWAEIEKFVADQGWPADVRRIRPGNGGIIVWREPLTEFDGKLPALTVFPEPDETPEQFAAAAEEFFAERGFDPMIGRCSVQPTE